MCTIPSENDSILYIALLRAVNVGGHFVKMEKLRALFSELGFSGVRSFIQSGNVFFRTTETDRQRLEPVIGGHLATALGFDVAVMVRTPGDLRAVIDSRPFDGVPADPDTRLLVFFLSRSLPEGLAFPVPSPKGDFSVIGGMPGTAFVVMKVTPGKVGNPGAFIEKRFDLKATGRFFNTTGDILRAALEGD